VRFLFLNFNKRSNINLKENIIEPEWVYDLGHEFIFLKKKLKINLRETNIELGWVHSLGLEFNFFKVENKLKGKHIEPGWIRGPDHRFNELSHNNRMIIFLYYFFSLIYFFYISFLKTIFKFMFQLISFICDFLFYLTFLDRDCFFMVLCIFNLELFFKMLNINLKEKYY
jgi:hypothetical protein